MVGRLLSFWDAIFLGAKYLNVGFRGGQLMTNLNLQARWLWALQGHCHCSFTRLGGGSQITAVLASIFCMSSTGICRFYRSNDRCVGFKKQ